MRSKAPSKWAYVEIKTERWIWDINLLRYYFKLTETAIWACYFIRQNKYSSYRRYIRYVLPYISQKINVQCFLSTLFSDTVYRVSSPSRIFVHLHLQTGSSRLEFDHTNLCFKKENVGHLNSPSLNLARWQWELKGQK